MRTVAQLDKQPTKNCGLLYNQLALLLIYCAPRPAMRGDGTQLYRAMLIFAMYANPHNNVVLALRRVGHSIFSIVYLPFAAQRCYSRMRIYTTMLCWRNRHPISFASIAVRRFTINIPSEGWVLVLLTITSHLFDCVPPRSSSN